MDVCFRELKESKKSRFDSYSIKNSVLIISHITFRDCRVHFFSTTFLEIAVCGNESRPGLQLVEKLATLLYIYS